MEYPEFARLPLLHAFTWDQTHHLSDLFQTLKNWHIHTLFIEPLSQAFLWSSPLHFDDIFHNLGTGKSSKRSSICRCTCMWDQTHHLIDQIQSLNNEEIHKTLVILSVRVFLVAPETPPQQRKKKTPPTITAKFAGTCKSTKMFVGPSLFQRVQLCLSKQEALARVRPFAVALVQHKLTISFTHRH